MSNRWPGGIVRNTPVTPSGPYQNSAASGIWTLADAAYWKKQGLWPDPNADAYWTYTSLLLSTTALGNANNNLFVDSSGAFNPVSRFGNTTQGSFTPYSTNWSNYFDGSGDYINAGSNAAFAFGTGAYTTEAWVYITGSNSLNNLFCNDTTNGFDLYFNYSSNTTLLEFRGGSNIITFNAIPTRNAWTHVALVREGTGSSQTKLYFNGVLQGSGTDATNWTVTGPMLIGAIAAGADLNGYISNARIVKGTAVYTANFRVPTAPLTAISGTSLLTCQSNRFRDASSNNFTITVNGNTSVTDFGPFSPGAAITYNQSDITNWSGYFDGSGDYLSFPSNTAFALGTGDFTIEAWVYTSDTKFMLFSSQTAGGIGFGYNLDNGSQGLWVGRVGQGPDATSGVLLTYNQWNHIAVTRQSNSVRFFVNGTQSGTTQTVSTNYGTSAQAFYVGRDYTTNFADFAGYASNARLVKGTALYTSNFTVPTSPLTAVSGTSLLTLQNAAFTENSANNFAITPSGEVTVTGNSPFNTTGYWSNYFDGSGDYERISSSQTALQFGTGDFTVEGWVYSTGGTGTYQHILTGGSSWASGSGGVFWYYNGGAPTLGCAWNQVTPNPAIQSSTLAVNTWHHFAVVRSGNTLTLYINGTSAGTLSVTGISLAVNNQSQTNIGGGGWDQDFTGYLSNLRVVKGTAVYTSNFTVPTTPLTAIANTSLLVCQSSRFIDSSTNAFTLVPAGNVAIQSFDPFYTSTIASNGGSMYFDGSGDYLSIPNSDALNFGTGDMTIECWVYLNTTSGTQTIASKWIPTVSWIWQFTSTTMTFYFGASGSSFSWSPATSTWYHLAITRSSGSVRFFVNGVQTGSTVTNTTSASSTSPMAIGANNDGPQQYLNGYVAGLRITKSALYTAAFTPPTAPVTPTAATTLLLNGMNAGIYDATTINDMETVGNAQVSTVQSKFGGSSVYFDGTGDNLICNAATPNVFAFGSGDFTIELWAYMNTVSGIQVFYDGRPAGVQTFAPTLYINGTQVRYFTNGADRITGGTVSTGTWYHIAVCRSGTSTRLFLDGTQIGSTYTDTNVYTNTAGRPGIGFDANASLYYLNGYIDDMRVTKGVARYTANFTPPTQAFPVY